MARSSSSATPRASPTTSPTARTRTLRGCWRTWPGGPVRQQPRSVRVRAVGDVVGEARGVAEDDDLAIPDRLLGHEDHVAEALAGVVAMVAHHRRGAALVAGVVPPPAADEHRPRRPADADGGAGDDAERVAVVANALLSG